MIAVKLGLATQFSNEVNEGESYVSLALDNGWTHEQRGDAVRNTVSALGELKGVVVFPHFGGRSS